jgi:hypothetical protein
MPSETILNNTLDQDSYHSLLNYFGVGVSSLRTKPIKPGYNDIELFVFSSTVITHSPRTLEGLLAWLKVYGHVLSPSKIRRMISQNIKHDSAVLGAFCDFIERYHQINFKIVKDLCQKKTELTSLTVTPLNLIRSYNPSFKKWNLAVTDYDCNEEKFLTSLKSLLNECLELKNRLIMGSAVNADLHSLFSKEKNYLKETQYEISKKIFHQRSSVRRALTSRPDELLAAIQC